MSHLSPAERAERWPWRWSVRINVALGGEPGRPLCSRVYALQPSWWRAQYLLAMDVIFREPHHCLNIHLCWISIRYLGGNHER